MFSRKSAYVLLHMRVCPHAPEQEKDASVEAPDVRCFPVASGEKVTLFKQARPTFRNISLATFQTLLQSEILRVVVYITGPLVGQPFHRAPVVPQDFQNFLEKDLWFWEPIRGYMYVCVLMYMRGCPHDNDCVSSCKRACVPMQATRVSSCKSACVPMYTLCVSSCKSPCVLFKKYL